MAPQNSSQMLVPPFRALQVQQLAVIVTFVSVLIPGCTWYLTYPSCRAVPREDSDIASVASAIEPVRPPTTTTREAVQAA